MKKVYLAAALALGPVLIIGCNPDGEVVQKTSVKVLELSSRIETMEAEATKWASSNSEHAERVQRLESQVELLLVQPLMQAASDIVEFCLLMKGPSEPSAPIALLNYAGARRVETPVDPKVKEATEAAKRGLAIARHEEAVARWTKVLERYKLSADSEIVVDVTKKTGLAGLLVPPADK